MLLEMELSGQMTADDHVHLRGKVSVRHDLNLYAMLPHDDPLPLYLANVSYVGMYMRVKKRGLPPDSLRGQGGTLSYPANTLQ
ncbi:hypothetical protein JIR001_08080 [Polycladomyces abyssicola]|uniref:Uncharacterized protein n=1 Tax=Polycladomyces abyssicola TaxID=1125966 RepID=A0A8D5UFG4_9BACL|nr:hypothetical protein JIR001_08080 [Polycladomyces abyssicola]